MGWDWIKYFWHELSVSKSQQTLTYIMHQFPPPSFSPPCCCAEGETMTKRARERWRGTDRENNWVHQVLAPLWSERGGRCVCVLGLEGWWEKSRTAACAFPNSVRPDWHFNKGCWIPLLHPRGKPSTHIHTSSATCAQYTEGGGGTNHAWVCMHRIMLGV